MGNFHFGKIWTFGNFFKLINSIRFAWAVFFLVVWRGKLNGPMGVQHGARPVGLQSRLLSTAPQLSIGARRLHTKRSTPKVRYHRIVLSVVTAAVATDSVSVTRSAQSAQTPFAYAARHTHPGCTIVCSSRRMRLVSSGSSRFTTSRRARTYVRYA